MGLETKLVQKLSQSLLMTPQLQQAIKLLQLGRLEYLEAIEKELLDNPLLEEIKDDAGSGSAEQDQSVQSDTDQPPTVMGDAGATDTVSSEGEPEARIDWEGYLESFTDSHGAATPRGLIDHDDRPGLEATAAKSETLAEHLAEQLRMIDAGDNERRVALYIVGNLDRNGYCTLTLEEVGEGCGCGPEEAQAGLDLVRSLDPAGVGARDLKDCLLIQLDNLGLADALESRIVSEHLDKLEKRRLDLIAKAEGVSVDDVCRAMNTIRRLEPRPARQFADESTRYVVPDIYVQRVGGEYVISLNEDGLPKLRVSSYYLDLLRNGDAENSPNRSYLNERLKAATWLIRSIHQRQQTIYRVTESIVKFQREFLDHGISKLKPLVLKDVAEDIGMHESTVSRVTTEKYVHTPQGVFELKYFFSTGIKGGDGDVSSSSVKERIRAIIGAESADSPVSDQAIVEMLKKEGIQIARRTVAKYREGLGILSSAQRKRPF